MLMERKLVKAKEYLKENKKDIAIAVAGSCICAIGFTAGWYGCMKSNGLKKGRHLITDDNLNAWLNNVDLTYPKEKCMTWLSTDEPLWIDNLEKKKKKIVRLGAPENATFTHFLAFGEPDKK